MSSGVSFAFLRLESGAQLEVSRESCSDFLLPLFLEKLMFKNAPTPQEFSARGEINFKDIQVIVNGEQLRVRLVWGQGM